ncbi:hypothetical protein [Nocardia sp. NPDC003979]
MKTLEAVHIGGITGIQLTALDEVVGRVTWSTLDHPAGFLAQHIPAPRIGVDQDRPARSLHRARMPRPGRSSRR